MLKNGEVNPLSVHGIQRSGWCPPHFTKITIDHIPEKPLIDWIYENLSGRFYVDVVDILEGNTYVRHLHIGFEDAGEATYFNLFLPELRKKNYN